MRNRILVLVVLLILGAVDLAAAQLKWTLPESDGGNLYLPSPEEEKGGLPWPEDTPRDFSHGTLSNPESTGGGYLMYGFISSHYGDGKLDFDSWQIPAWKYRAPGQKTTAEMATGHVRIELRQGDFSLTVGGTYSKEKPLTGGWRLYRDSHIGAPSFGMGDIIQKDNKGTYASGPKTIAQAGCLLCSFLAWGHYYGDPSWDINQFNDEMVDAGGFSGNDVRSSVAARLLGLVYMGEVSYSKKAVEKYMARHWGLIAGVTRPCGYHWICINPGVVLKPGKYFFGIMDPAQRGRWLHETKYNPRRLKIVAPSIVPAAVIQPVKAPDGSSGSMTSLLIACAQIEAVSATGTFIESVETPEFVLTKDNSGLVSEWATLVDSPGDDLCDDELDDGASFAELLPTDNRSESNIVGASAGRYVYHLAGSPLTKYQLSVVLISNIGTIEIREFQGQLDENGKAAVILDFNPGYVVEKLGEMRSFGIGTPVLVLAAEVTDVDADGFFAEALDRSCGIRVISSMRPAVGSRVKIVGTVKSVSPELVLEASQVESQAGIATIKPLGISTANWPEMANCLLARIWGRVETVDGTRAVLSNGSGASIVVEEIDIPVSPGDFLTFNAVLRANRTLRAIAGSCRTVE